MITLTEGNDVLNLTLTQNESIDALGGDDVVTITGAPFPPEGEQQAFPLYDITVNGGAGDDQINIIDLVKSAVIYGGDGDDRFYGYNDGNDFDEVFGFDIYGGAGNDQFYTNYFAHGGDGDDVFYRGGSGDNGDDILYYGGSGGAGSDKIFGGILGGESQIDSSGFGGAGDDYLYGAYQHGGEGSDFLEGAIMGDGGAGNDIIGDNGDFYLDGGSGRDAYLSRYALTWEPGIDKLALPDQHYVVSAFTGRAHEILLTGGQAFFDDNGDGAADDGPFEMPGLTQDDILVQLFLGSAVDETSDIVNGTAAAEFIYGGGGNDTLSGGQGIDFVFGGFGADTVSGNSGDDLVVGNGGDDRLYGGSGNDELDGGDGDDALSGSTGDDFAYGGAGADIIAGGAGMDRLLGEIGNDRINGGEGDDILSGGQDNDILRGDAGNDVIGGDNGNDVIYGGLGKDVLTGGGGADRFAFAAGDSKAGGSFRDVITDFTSGVDKLDLTALHITDYAGQISFRTVGSGLIVSADTNGNGFDYSDFAVQLTGVSALQAGDFILA